MLVLSLAELWSNHHFKDSSPILQKFIFRLQKLWTLVQNISSYRLQVIIKNIWMVFWSYSSETELSILYIKRIFTM
jgi:hypothetical protein